jgi:hypothetical protein
MLFQSTARVVMLKLFASADHVTAATGKTVAITIQRTAAPLPTRPPAPPTPPKWRLAGTRPR